MKKIYHPWAVLGLTLLFTPLWGGMLVRKNATQIDEPILGVRAKQWSRITVAMILLYFVTKHLFPTHPMMTWAGPYLMLVLWLGWITMVGFTHIRLVKLKTQNHFESLPLARPLMLGGLGWILFTMVSMSLSVGMKMLTPATPPKEAVVIKVVDNNVVVEPHAIDNTTTPSSTPSNAP